MKLHPSEVKAAQSRLLRGVDCLHEYIAQGDQPDDAAIKVATDLSLPAGEIRLLAAAFNTGQSAGCRQGSLLSEKVAEFSLVDPDAVIARVYPTGRKTAAEEFESTVVSRTYNEEPYWLDRRSKKAAARPSSPKLNVPPVPFAVNHELDSRNIKEARIRSQRERDDLYQEFFELRSKAASAMESLTHYFRNYGSIPVDQVVANCNAIYGPAASPLLEKLSQLKATQPAQEAKLQPVAAEQEPYVSINLILKTAATYQNLFERIDSFEKRAAKAELGIHWKINKPQPLPADASLSVMRRINGEKRAAVTTVTGGIGSGIGESLMARLMPSSGNKVKDDAFSDLTSPDHERRLRAIRAQAVMHELMNSPYFEGENPQHVADAFNRVTKLSPRLVENPIALEAVLRRHVSQGQSDPHDLTQILDMDKGLRDRDALVDPRHLPVVSPSLVKT